MLPSKESTFSILERRFLNWSLDLMSHDNHNSQREKFYFWRCVVLMTVSFTVLFCITQGFTSNHETVCVSTHRRLVAPNPNNDEAYAYFKLIEEFSKSIEYNSKKCYYENHTGYGCKLCAKEGLKDLNKYCTIDEILTKVKDMNPDRQLKGDLLKKCVERAYVFEQYRDMLWDIDDANFLASSYKTKFVSDKKADKDDIEEQLQWYKENNPTTFGNPDTREPDKDDDQFRRKPGTTKDSGSYWQGS